MTPAITNIGEIGARRRRIGGVIWLVIAIVAAAALATTDSPRWWRLLLVFPFGLAATGFLQAREKTCVFLGALGKREGVGGGASCPLTSAELPVIRRRSVLIAFRATVLAIAATAACWFF